MTKILFLHGFTSSGRCEIAETLKSDFQDEAVVVAPDIPLHPYEAMDMLRKLCASEQFDLIVGSSCGAFYGQQLVGITGLRAILISPFLKMTDFLKPRLGWHRYKSLRADGRQEFEIDKGLLAEFAQMESHQFDNYDEKNRYRVWGMFGSQDTLAHYRDVFEKYYAVTIDYDGPHTMTIANIRNDLEPSIKKMLNEVIIR